MDAALAILEDEEEKDAGGVGRVIEAETQTQEDAVAGARHVSLGYRSCNGPAFCVRVRPRKERPGTHKAAECVDVMQIVDGKLIFMQRVYHLQVLKNAKKTAIFIFLSCTRGLRNSMNPLVLPGHVRNFPGLYR